MKERATKTEQKMKMKPGFLPQNWGPPQDATTATGGGDHQFACIIAGKEGGEGRQMKDGRRFFAAVAWSPTQARKKCPKATFFVHFFKSRFMGGGAVSVREPYIHLLDVSWMICLAFDIFEYRLF